MGSFARGRARPAMCGMAGGGPCPGLSGEVDPPGGAVPAGRTERRHRQGGRAEDAGPARPTGDHRQPCRRRRRARHRLRREVRSRRLHHRHRERRRAGDQLQPAGQDPLRSAQGSGPDHAGRQGAGIAGRFDRRAGLQRQGTGGARQGKTRADQFRIDRTRQHAPSRRRAVAHQCRHRHRACALSRRGAGRERSRRPPVPDHVRRRSRAAAAGSGGQDQGARGGRPYEGAGAAGPADHAGTRLFPDRSRQLVRHGRRRQDAAGDRRQAQCRRGRRPRGARGEGEAVRPGRDPGRGYAAAIRRLRARRGRQMGEGRRGPPASR